MDKAELKAALSKGIDASEKDPKLARHNFFLILLKNILYWKTINYKKINQHNITKYMYVYII